MTITLATRRASLRGCDYGAPSVLVSVRPSTPEPSIGVGEQIPRAPRSVQRLWRGEAAGWSRVTDMWRVRCYLPPGRRCPTRRSASLTSADRMTFGHAFCTGFAITRRGPQFNALAVQHRVGYLALRRKNDDQRGSRLIPGRTPHAGAGEGGSSASALYPTVTRRSNRA
jgi:hypothetical protein